MNPNKEKQKINKIIEIFKKNKKRPLIIDSLLERKYSYSELETLSQKFARVLSEAKIKKLDKVVIILPNCIEYIIIYFACMQVGAIPVPINYRLRPREINLILSDIKAKNLIISKSMEKIINNSKNFLLAMHRKFLFEVICSQLIVQMVFCLIQLFKAKHRIIIFIF